MWVCLLKAQLQSQPTAVFLGGKEKKNEVRCGFHGAFPDPGPKGSGVLGDGSSKEGKGKREMSFRRFPTSLWDIDHF